jgi:hypothetical protein
VKNHFSSSQTSRALTVSDQTDFRPLFTAQNFAAAAPARVSFTVLCVARTNLNKISNVKSLTRMNSSNQRAVSAIFALFLLLTTLQYAPSSRHRPGKCSTNIFQSILVLAFFIPFRAR